MFLVSSWSFQNGFLDYINRSQLDKLEGLSIALQNIYKEDKSWVRLDQNHRLWRELIRDRVIHPAQPRESTLLRSSRDDKDRRRPPHHRKATMGKLILFDKNKNRLVGPPRSVNEVLYRPLYESNKVIGFIGLEKRLELSHTLDQVFAEQQRRSYAWIAFGSLLISLIVALPFSAKIIRPILDLLKGTQELAQGNYQSRVDNPSKDEIGQLSTSFNSMADSIEAHQKTQQQWVADISHELRTPLGVLKGEIEAILDGIRQASPENIESLHQEINYVNRLVEDLHELAKSDIKALSLQKESFPLYDLLNEVKEIFSQENESKGFNIDIQCDKSLVVFADRSRLTQVFVNLFQNNLRYTKKGANISIKAEKNTAISVQWEDSGPGVASQNLDKLFQRLYREDASRSSFTRGSGLGLSICKSIIENHGGSMQAYPSSLGGLGININLPN